MEVQTATPAANEQEHVDIDRALHEFEARCDKSDPAQLALLETMREHTRRLHQKRGDWNKPNARRNWNAAKVKDVKAPMAIDSYRAYKEHLQKEEAWQQLQQQRQGPVLALEEAAAEDEGSTS